MSKPCNICYNSGFYTFLGCKNPCRSCTLIKEEWQNWRLYRENILYNKLISEMSKDEQNELKELIKERQGDIARMWDDGGYLPIRN